MELIRPDTNIDFVGKRLIAIACSAVLILVGIVSLVAKGGPEYGIDFAGGTLLQVQIAAPTDAARVRELLKELPLRGVSIQQFGEGANEYLIKMQESSAELKGVSADIQAALEKGYGAGKVEIRRTEMVGPQVGKDLRQKGLLALLFAIVGMLIYITWRFELRFGVGAVIALAHDVFITIAIFSVFNLEIDLTIVAALLTIIGYSVNDTVIVCDRIRENMGRHSKESLSWIINRSINETLSRTFMTSGLTLLSVTALYFFGGSVIQNFALAMLLGITVGTYSSIYVASPVILFWESHKARRLAAAK
ncbi:MAG: protein-export membrane protein SecF [Desulfuromonadales bacterium GWD2_61_12]|nr:MAG: protein-export membrane protein SecF [Desulfuromonadales bacterium GWC2_61_20]OGR35189.1 MAG: protein-export membrane protein SecF [Desulfuromonadales bacterium GWD2_61_12]HAD04066.1 protein translocase subunit SecF [Desulfuromonas sp.]HBT83499.1 protein translocase subunit SecF [Desulfuromonas sp.]